MPHLMYLIFTRSHFAARLIGWSNYGAASFVTIVIGALLSGCCNDITCNGGFTLEATMADQGALPVGELTIYAQIEEDEIRVQCNIKEPYEDPACELPIGGPENLSMIAWIDQKAGEADGGINGEQVSRPVSLTFIAFYLEKAQVDHNSSERGPRLMSIRYESNGVNIGQGEYSPSYTRDKEYWGNKMCGYCDLGVKETLQLTRPIHVGQTNAL